MIKAILFDVDEVVIKREKYFSQKYSEEYKVPQEQVMEFFKGEYQDCAIGKMDLKEVLPKYLKKWGWQGSLEEFMDYWFTSETELNEPLLEVVKQLREKGVLCCLATNNEKYRAQYLLDVVGLKDYFDQAFVSAFVGAKKSQAEFYKYIFNDLNLKPEEIMFWDSAQGEVDVAKHYLLWL